MDQVLKDRLLTEHLSAFISAHKKEFIEKVLDARTRYITLVLEDIYQSQNASAAVRTCECLGLQDLHIIESMSSWTTNKLVLKGSNKWLDIIRYKKKGANNTEECFANLRKAGYRIGVTDPSPDGIALDDVSIDTPLAIVMGNEKHGSSEYARTHSDFRLFIPMAGFTESLNISVSAAICLNSILTRLRSSDVNWNLTDKEKDQIRLKWFKTVVRKSDVLEREFLRTVTRSTSSG